jgi:hypothetical protein
VREHEGKWMMTLKASTLAKNAIANEAPHAFPMAAKARDADAAKAKCAELVARAAAGAEVNAAELMQAQDDLRMAQAGVEIAAAIQRGVEKRKWEAEISAWFDQAAQLANAVEQSLDERFAAAAEVDSRLAELNRAVTRFNEAGREFSKAKIAAAHFTADREARMTNNPVLRMMPAGTHPKATNNYNAEIRQVCAIIFNTGGSLERPVPIESLVQREAFLWGRMPAKKGAES